MRHASSSGEVSSAEKLIFHTSAELEAIDEVDSGRAKDGVCEK
jgi:hypothetical protein